MHTAGRVRERGRKEKKEKREKEEKREKRKKERKRKEREKERKERERGGLDRTSPGPSAGRGALPPRPRRAARPGGGAGGVSWACI